MDEAVDAVGQGMASDVLSVDVQLVEDDFGDGSLDGVTASAVEALGVGEQGQGGPEELAAFFELVGGVGELGLDVDALALDGVELVLDLGSGPVRVTK
ncbi:hypothetical protein [Actinokineospora spheciospongiae]|uniref:hypothetical protein n=1 Tax=Actinokineospora spheciospongiae TaxID=909613 RepID=UPI0011B6AD2E|nr:hypothetical protein [Actinokineospora spheciospongiae]